MKRCFYRVYFSLLLILLCTHFSSAQLVSDFRVNDDTTNYNQTDAKVGIDGQGNFIIVWGDSRRGNLTTNIFCQRFDSLANRLGNNFTINSILDSASSPQIAVRRDGSFGVCWKDINSQVLNRSFAKFRLFNKYGVPISSEIIINDTITTYSINSTIGTDSSGNFVVAFQFQSRNGGNDYDIYYQRINKNGNKIGNNIKVNDDIGYYYQNYPTIAVRQNGVFIITWQDQRPPVPMNGCDDIYMQMYDSSGNKIGNNSRVNDIINLQDYEFNPYISSDTSGAFCIIFTRADSYSNEFRVFIQFYDKNGNKIGNNINVSSMYNTFSKAISKRNNGDMIIGFNYDNGFIFRQYIQRIKFSGEIIGNVFQITNQVSNLSNWFCDALLFNNKIISLFTDYRNGNLDIFCNVRSFINPDSVITKVINVNHKTPTEFILCQNYPNPFNSITSIKYSVPSNIKSETSYIKLVVYNILGKEITTLVNEKQKPGTYEVRYDASELTSGIYYYTLQFENQSRTKTLVVIK